MDCQLIKVNFELIIYIYLKVGVESILNFPFLAYSSKSSSYIELFRIIRDTHPPFI
jgi:hypothetical protein